MNIRIYQINMDRDNDRKAFMGLGELEHFFKKKEIDSGIYDCVFNGCVDCKGLKNVYEKFNIDHPDGYIGRSLSVSDIVEVIEAEDVDKGFYYCDNIGFSKVDFEPENAKPYAKETIKVLMVEPGKKAYEKEIGTSLEEMYAALNCQMIQTFYPFEDMVVIVCDDEGKINGSRPNRAVYGEDGKMMDIICGRFFICDCSTESFRSLPPDMMDKYKKMFYFPERFVRFNGEIAAVKYDPDKEAAR